MKTLLIREVPDAVHDSLIAAAEKNRRSKEKQALHLIETALADGTAETCGFLTRISLIRLSNVFFFLGSVALSFLSSLKRIYQCI